MGGQHKLQRQRICFPDLVPPQPAYVTMEKTHKHPEPEFLQQLKGKRKTTLKYSKKISIFVDMDGVVADYRFGELENIKNNKPDLYLNKKSMYTTINNLKIGMETKGLQ